VCFYLRTIGEECVRGVCDLFRTRGLEGYLRGVEELEGFSGLKLSVGSYEGRLWKGKVGIRLE
jgi:hypothetical protein